MLNQETILAKIQADLNALVIDLGFIDGEGRPLYYFYGEVSTYDNYDWIKSIETYNEDSVLRYLPVIPFALIRDNSTPSAAEHINERLDEYSLYGFLKTSQMADVRLIFETYMTNENMENNLTTLDTSTVLKVFSNFVIDDETLTGAPDGESRHQATLKFTYDIFEDALTSSKDWELLIDNVPAKYLSWRFEKANMTIANSANTTSGLVLNNLDKLHEVVLVCEIYLDTSNSASNKLRDDVFSWNRTNILYNIKLTLKGETVFERGMTVNGGKTTDTPPQINTVEVTFAPSYQRASVLLGLVGEVDGSGEQVYTNIPVYTYKFGHAAALYTATYFGNNASKSSTVGLAKGILLIIPVLTDTTNTVMQAIVKEVLGRVYTNKYALKLDYLGETYTYTTVLNDSAIESSDAAYDVMSLVFVEAK